MSCEEYRRLVNRWLDARESSPLDGEAESHARGCAGCRSYARAMVRIDAGLRDLPEVQVPEEILESALCEGGRVPGSGRAFLIRCARGAAPGLPAAMAWILSGLLPPPSDIVLRFTLASASMALFALSVFRPRLST